jgi:hypothetical protein
MECQQKKNEHEKAYVFVHEWCVFILIVCVRYCRIRNWRQKEAGLVSLAAVRPHEITVIRYDDTIAVSVPHLGNRTDKTLSKKHPLAVRVVVHYC